MQNVTQFVAECSSNHGQDLARCLQFVDTAADIGCDFVKFQLFKVDQMWAPEILAKSSLHRARVDWELPVHFLPFIAARCQERKIRFVCTPFHLQAVEDLLPYVNAYKIASYELLWNDLLKACVITGKPIILSTGMATVNEINEAVDSILTAGCRDLTLLHCISSYPAPPEECNLRAIDTMRRRWFLPVGLSDHSANANVLYRAIYRWKASMIEFHLDLDTTGAEYTQGHCWLPSQIRPIIEAVSVSPVLDGSGMKRPMPSELADRAWRRDSSDGLRPLLATRETWQP